VEDARTIFTELGDDMGGAAALRTEAELAARAGKPADALALAEQATLLAGRTVNPESSEALGYSLRLARAERENGATARAVERYRAVISVLERDRGPAERALPGAHSGLARACAANGSLPESEHELALAVTSAVSAFGADHPATAAAH